MRLPGLAGAVAVLAFAAAGCGGGGGSTTAAAPSTNAAAAGGGGSGCSGTVTIGMLAPITGPAASIGGDQLHWAQFFVARWNQSNSPKLKLVEGDTQLDPSKASTVSQQFASNRSIVGVIGPAGSDEVQAVAPILKRAGFAFVSGSATRVSLSDGHLKGFFFRVVPNDSVQGPTDVAYMTTKLGVGKGDTVMVVDDQEAYSTGLADIVQKGLRAKGVTVDRESVSQKATDFSSLIAKIGASTKVVFLPWQLASQAQLFAQQLEAQAKQAVVFGSDGTFDVSKFNVDGNYISFFAPDVTTIPADAKIVKAFHAQHPGATSPFGAPNYVAAQVFAQAVQQACKSGDATRASVRKQVAQVQLSDTLVGGPLSFTANGDVAGAKFHIFKIENGKYVTVQ